MIVLASGGFDPLHAGHVEYLEKAAELGDRLVVALNSDDWLMRKKGYRMMSWEDRKRLLLGLRCVDEVIPVDDSDGTVQQAIRCTLPDVFAKGGDRTTLTTPEVGLCAELGIRFVDGLGPKVASSSTIYRGALPAVQRAWGTYTVLFRAEGLQVKVLDIEPDKSTSLQRHSGRREVFVFPDGRTEKALEGEWHQLSGGANGTRVVEVQIGPTIEEDDIERA